MIHPQARAKQILNDPALAECLFELMLWAADQSNLKENDDYDDILDMAWTKMQQSRDARAAYAKKRLAGAKKRLAAVKLPLTSSAIS